MMMCNRVELHIFCDASEQAFAAVGFFKCFNPDGIVVSIVMSKSRVAPVKPMSIPRLELQAVVLGSRLATHIRESHEITIVIMRRKRGYIMMLMKKLNILVANQKFVW